MKRAFILIMLVSALPILASAQQIQHVHPNIKVIDGRTNPELIPDSDAYRLYLLSLTTKVNPTANEAGYQGAAVNSLGFDGLDHIVLLGVLRDFRDRYDNLVSRFNDQATAAQKRGEVVNQKLFRQQLDDLTTSVRLSLKRSLSSMASDSIDQKVQEAKKHIKHFESAPEAQ